ncbi:MAG: hypothetical protein A3G23_03920 [Bacteroidetes bacterium RIFCSPLOWO2_12_FULL_37_12]|nr:MAG: hypothetical protein A3G23_03920 [Bacteroidetes bacterium RIFCSPLOWO2_12_FULL_37_12]
MAESNPEKKFSKKLAIIDATGCTGCCVCMEFCEFDAIVKIPGPINEIEDISSICQVDLELCTGCSLCAKPCPWDVIQIFEKEVVPAEEIATAANKTIFQRKKWTAGSLTSE